MVLQIYLYCLEQMQKNNLIVDFAVFKMKLEVGITFAFASFSDDRMIYLHHWSYLQDGNSCIVVNLLHA